MRLCDLELELEGTSLQARIDRVQRELAAKGFRFQPHFWLAEEWFTPLGIPGIGVPFYLAHPRLARLEMNQMLEVEGGTHDWCLRILRHEVGHAIDNAYRLQRRRKRQQIFGKSSEPYPETYSPKPYSKSYVLHLDAWYAQSHPDEDFAETFAVWLNGPRSAWRKRYAGWPALKKLEYIDELMNEIAERAPLSRSRRTVEPLHRIKKTLREHYAEKRARYGLDYPDFYDRDLLRLFTDDRDAPGPAAVVFIRRHRKEIRRKVAWWTGTYQYTIDQVLTDMARRCRELRLRLAGPEEQAVLDFTVLLTVQTMNYLQSGRHRVAL